MWTCAVIVLTDGHENSYTVTVRPDSLARWASGSDQPAVEDLVARSFEFLLERESADSILKSFDLAVIQSYFTEYDRTFRR